MCDGSLKGESNASFPIAPKEESVFVAAAYARGKEVVNGVPMIRLEPPSGFNDDRLKLVTMEGRKSRIFFGFFSGAFS